MEVQIEKFQTRHKNLIQFLSVHKILKQPSENVRMACLEDIKNFIFA